MLLEHNIKEFQVKELPPLVTRGLVFVKGSSGLMEANFDDTIVEKLGVASWESGVYTLVVEAHQAMVDDGVHILGITEETSEHFLISQTGKKYDVVSTRPDKRTVWVGENVRIYTQEEAGNLMHNGHSAMDWAMRGRKERPARVVQAKNGFFYPATEKDMVINTE